VAGLALAVAIQCHFLAAILGPPLLVAWLIDIRRSQRDIRRPVVRSGLVGLLLVALSFLPLLAHELTHDFTELRALVAFLSSIGSGGSSGPGLPVRAVLVALRVTEWPVVGLFVDALPLSILVFVFVLGTIVWRLQRGSPLERDAMAFAAGTLAWSWVALTLLVPSLGTVVRELPVDHYHAFLDPIVVGVIGVGLAALVKRDVVGQAIAIVGFVVLAGWNLFIQPPLVSPDLGWPGGEAAGERILAASGGAPIAFATIPEFKGPGAYRFPVERARATVLDDPSDLPAGGILVVLCDRLFSDAGVGADCGGAPDDAYVAGYVAANAGTATPPTLVDRFEAAPGRIVSLYRVVAAG
jgi:hypothetical protein